VRNAFAWDEHNAAGLLFLRGWLVESANAVELTMIIITVVVFIVVGGGMYYLA